MQIKTIIRYHLTPVRVAIINKWPTINGGEGVEVKEPSYTVGGNVLVQPLWRTVWRFLKKLKTQLPYNPATLLLDLYPEKNMVQKDTCTQCSAPFTTANTWNQSKCPLTDERIKKMWCTYTMEYLLSH